MLRLNHLFYFVVYLYQYSYTNFYFYDLTRKVQRQKKFFCVPTLYRDSYTVTDTNYRYSGDYIDGIPASVSLYCAWYSIAGAKS